MANEVQQTKMLKEDEKMFFKTHYKRLKCPYVIYGDFECLATPTTEGIKGIYRHHQPCGFILNVVNSITNEATHTLHGRRLYGQILCNRRNFGKDERKKTHGQRIRKKNTRRLTLISYAIASLIAQTQV